MGNRVYQRIQVHGFQADISDGVGFFPGTVSDVSRFGLCMTDLPQRLDETSKKLTVVVNGRGKNFKMLVKPRWSEKQGRRKIVRCEIINTPYSWTDFIISMEPEEKRDTWDTIDL